MQERREQQAGSPCHYLIAKWYVNAAAPVKPATLRMKVLGENPVWDSAEFSTRGVMDLAFRENHFTSLLDFISAYLLRLSSLLPGG